MFSNMQRPETSLKMKEAIITERNVCCRGGERLEHTHTDRTSHRPTREQRRSSKRRVTKAKGQTRKLGIALALQK